MRSIVVVALCLLLGTACGKDATDAGAKQPPREQVLRDAQDRVQGQLAPANITATDFKVESVETDPYEKDQAKATVSYQARGLRGSLGLTYRRAEDFWKLEGTVDLGLK